MHASACMPSTAAAPPTEPRLRARVRARFRRARSAHDAGKSWREARRSAANGRRRAAADDAVWTRCGRARLGHVEQRVAVEADEHALRPGHSCARINGRGLSGRGLSGRGLSGRGLSGRRRARARSDCVMSWSGRRRAGRADRKACVCVCARACARVCACVCACVCVWMCGDAGGGGWMAIHWPHCTQRPRTKHGRNAARRTATWRPFASALERRRAEQELQARARTRKAPPGPPWRTTECGDHTRDQSRPRARASGSPRHAGTARTFMRCCTNRPSASSCSATP